MTGEQYNMFAEAYELLGLADQELEDERPDDAIHSITKAYEILGSLIDDIRSHED